MTIGSILRPFGIFYGYLVYPPRFGLLYQEKSGNPHRKASVSVTGCAGLGEKSPFGKSMIPNVQNKIMTFVHKSDTLCQILGNLRIKVLDLIFTPHFSYGNISARDAFYRLQSCVRIIQQIY
jgi:hypothetical protein